MRLLKALFPVVLFLLLTSNAYARAEICGDGIDNDSSGGERYCTGPDTDSDGFSANDCDDESRWIYPGIWTSSGCASGYFRKCQEDGTYSACQNTAPCEKTGSGNCYYIDNVNGSDSNNGTSVATAWQTLKMISRYASATPPTGHHDLVAGDVVYLLTGTYDETYVDGATTKLLELRSDGSSGNRITIKAYPGATPVLYPNAADVIAINVDTADYVTIEGLTIHDAQTGIYSESTTGNIFNNNIIYNSLQAAGSNNACIKGTDISTVSIHHNRLYDCYDRDAPTNENNAGITLFTGTGQSITYNVIYYSAPTTVTGGYCYKSKSGTSGGTVTFSNNICFDTPKGIGIAQDNATVENNRVYGAAVPYETADIGGSFYPHNQIIRYNTFWFTDSCYKATIDEADVTASGNIFRYNICYHTGSSYYDTGGMLRFWVYANEANCDAMGTGWTINSNCYYDDDNTQYAWNVCHSDYGIRATTLANWQGFEWGEDAASFVENPTFNSSDVATSANCGTFGWKAYNGQSSSSSSSSSSTSGSVYVPGFDKHFN